MLFDGASQVTDFLESTNSPACAPFLLLPSHDGFSAIFCSTSELLILATAGGR